jgi:hypothetical protein
MAKWNAPEVIIISIGDLKIMGISWIEVILSITIDR